MSVEAGQTLNVHNQFVGCPFVDAANRDAKRFGRAVLTQASQVFARQIMPVAAAALEKKMDPCPGLGIVRPCHAVGPRHAINRAKPFETSQVGFPLTPLEPGGKPANVLAVYTTGAAGDFVIFGQTLVEP